MKNHDYINKTKENNSKTDKRVENTESMIEDEYFDSDINNDFDDDLDYELEARLASYGDDDAENDEGTVREFLSRDNDIIAESRKRVNQPGKRVVRTNEKTGKDRKSLGEKKNGSISGSAGTIVENCLEFYHNHTIKILYSVLGGLAVILVITMIILPKGEPKTDEKDSDTTNVETTTPEVEATTEPETDAAIQPEAEDSEIQILINSYFDAAYMKADMDEVANYVDDITNINVEKYKSRQKYIESFHNVKAYKIDSAIENTFIVFVTYDAKINNIETLAPSAETFIVVYNDADKKMYIHNPTVAEELDGYIAEGSNLSAISELSQDVRNRLDEALAADAELKKVFDIMTGAGQGNTEDSSAEGQ